MRGEAPEGTATAGRTVMGHAEADRLLIRQTCGGQAGANSGRGDNHPPGGDAERHSSHMDRSVQGGGGRGYRSDVGSFCGATVSDRISTVSTTPASRRANPITTFIPNLPASRNPA